MTTFGTNKVTDKQQFNKHKTKNIQYEKEIILARGTRVQHEHDRPGHESHEGQCGSSNLYC